MNKEEYYSRMKKLDCRQMTDRTSRDEDFYIEHQRNYLSKQYIKTLEQENQQLKENKKELIEFLKEYDKYRDSFKWNEQDYIDTIEKIKGILGDKE